MFFLAPLSPEDRAERCFRAHLSSGQLAQYLKTKRFQVRGSAGGDYVIFCDAHGAHIYRVENDTGVGLEVRNFCSKTQTLMPAADWFLMHKLYLETNEPLFLGIAAASGLSYTADREVFFHG